MKIGIIGAGRVGSAPGSSRCEETGSATNARRAPVMEAAQSSGVAAPRTPWEAVDDALIEPARAGHSTAAAPTNYVIPGTSSGFAGAAKASGRMDATSYLIAGSGSRRFCSEVSEGGTIGKADMTVEIKRCFF